MPTVQTIVALVNRLWKTGNVWARWAIALTTGWPPVLALVAMLGFRPLTSLFGLVPVAALVFALVAWTDPLVLPILAVVQAGRTFLQLIGTILAFELLLGVYFALIPVHVDPGLVPLLLLAASALLFLSLGTRFPGVQVVQAGLCILLVAITAAFMLGGWDELLRLALKAVQR